MGNMTIKDIARISGCSVSTISRVINDRPDVRPETKERVLEVMREAGFVPNTNARQLKIQQSRSLVFVVKGTRNIFFSDFLVQLQRAATLYGYNGIVSYLDENANEIDAAEKILREIKPKGMIFLGGSVANFQKGFANISVPSVLATLVSDELDFPNLSMVGVDDRAAAYQAVSYLIQQGHRKIAVLGGPATFNVLYTTQKFHDDNQKTYRAFYRALSEAAKIINADKKAAAAAYIRTEKSRLPQALVEKIVNDPEIDFTVSPQRTFVYAEKLHELGVLKNKADSWKDYFFNEAWENPGS